MAHSVSVGMLIGFESIEAVTLQVINKKFNLKSTGVNYRHAIERIHHHGLAVWATIIFGTDMESPALFDRFARRRTARGDGGGLGLALVRELAVLHHASVPLADSAWGGTSVTIEFAAA